MSISVFIFCSFPLSQVTRLNLQRLDEERNERRQHMAADFMSQRLTEAEHLMGSIIVDKPEMPDWGALATGEGILKKSWIKNVDPLA